MIGIVMLVLFSLSVVATEITDCQGLNQGNYYLTDDIDDYSGDYQCWTFNTGDTLLDCQGHYIDCDGEGTDQRVWGSGDLQPNANITIENCILQNCKFGGYFWNSSGITIRNSEFRNMTNNALIFFMSSDISVENNYFYEIGFGEDALYENIMSNNNNDAGTYSNFQIINNTFEDSRAWNTFALGSDAGNVHNIGIINNTFININSRNNIMFWESYFDDLPQNLTITGNHFEDTNGTSYMILISGYEHVLIADNEFDNLGTGAVSISLVDDLTFSNNLVDIPDGASWDDIEIFNSTNIIIDDNEFYNNGAGIGGTTGSIGAEIYNLTISNNLFVSPPSSWATILLYYVHDLDIYSNNFTGGYRGIQTYCSSGVCNSNVNVYDNYFYNQSDRALNVFRVNGSLIYNNYFENMNKGFAVYQSSDQEIYDNEFYNMHLASMAVCVAYGNVFIHDNIVTNSDVGYTFVSNTPALGCIENMPATFVNNTLHDNNIGINMSSTALTHVVSNNRIYDNIINIVSEVDLNISGNYYGSTGGIVPETSQCAVQPYSEMSISDYESYCIDEGWLCSNWVCLSFGDCELGDTKSCLSIQGFPALSCTDSEYSGAYTEFVGACSYTVVTPVIQVTGYGIYDTLSETGTGIGSMVDNLRLPVGQFILFLAVIGGVVALILGIVFAVRKMTGKYL